MSLRDNRVFLTAALDRSRGLNRRILVAQEGLRELQTRLRRSMPVAAERELQGNGDDRSSSKVVLARIETSRAAIDLAERTADLGLAIGDAIEQLLDTPLAGVEAWHARRLVRRNLRELSRWATRCEREVVALRKLSLDLP
jgi:hypothetical protein